VKSKARKSFVERNTNETRISAELLVEGTGKYSIKTPVPFLSHLLESFAKQGLFDLKLQCVGDIEVDQHHTVEDLGIVLGEAFKKALGQKKGINRAGFFVFPMDDALATVAVDLGGRPFTIFDVEFRRRFCGDLDTDLFEEFFRAFANSCRANVAVKMPFGKNDHHKAEAVFKAFGKAMKQACEINSRAGKSIPSTKGNLD
jgi:imidazoleglycerol-phosphate dehydratase